VSNIVQAQVLPDAPFIKDLFYREFMGVRLICFDEEIILLSLFLLPSFPTRSDEIWYPGRLGESGCAGSVAGLGLGGLESGVFCRGEQVNWQNTFLPMPADDGIGLHEPKPNPLP
jgi:hypothetical protein